MVFSSVSFLFVFLPLTLLLYFLGPTIYPVRFIKRDPSTLLPSREMIQNLLLLLASVAFYALGTPELWFLIVISIGIDAVCARGQVGATTLKGKRRWLVISIVANLSLLFYFKYVEFFIESCNTIAASFGYSGMSSVSVILPVGISFYTFQTISYQIDLYRGDIKYERSLLNFSLFVALFPQLVAGPIVRYRDISEELRKRSTPLSGLAYGSFRFITGLAKKVLLADNVGRVVDYCFSRPPEALPIELAWLGAVLFTIQVYLDFSAYSDMAIGLGRIFGYTFPENFRYPLIARSIGEFWQRWHITLTTWFRDYVYKPLRNLPGGRRQKSVLTIFVFLLVGLWHGASWTFVLWGVFHGVLLVCERKLWLRHLRRLPRAAQHLYVLTLVSISAIFFRAESFEQILVFLHAMIGFGPPAAFDGLFFIQINPEVVVITIVSALICTPAPFQALQALWRNASHEHRPLLRPVVQSTAWCFLIILFMYVSGEVAATAKNPFIYFRF